MTQATKKFVWVTFQRKGFHFYPGAPDAVAYLKSRHRHLFKFKVKLQVYTDDREIEFHMMLNEIESWYDQGLLELDHRSCEMMANDLFACIEATYRSPTVTRECVIEVSEDGECGCESYYTIDIGETK